MKAITVKVTEDRYNEIQQLAETLGVTFTAAIRHMLVLASHWELLAQT